MGWIEKSNTNWYIEVYSNETECLVSEHKLGAIDPEMIRNMLEIPKDDEDPGMYEGFYELTERHKFYIEKFTGKKADFNMYAYHIGQLEELE